MILINVLLGEGICPNLRDFIFYMSGKQLENIFEKVKTALPFIVTICAVIVAIHTVMEIL